METDFGWGSKTNDGEKIAKDVSNALTHGRTYKECL